MKQFRLPFFLLLTLVLSACSFSLAEDITPPPGFQAPVVTPSATTTSAGPVETPVSLPTQVLAVTVTIPVTATGAITSSVGIITGQIINASGSDSPSGLEVTLHGLDQMQLVYSDTTTTQAGGFYTFTNVLMPTGRAFLTSLLYQGAGYGSDVAQITAGMTKVTLNATIYDTTTDTSSISADRLHIFLDFSNPGVVQIAELYIISNPGNKTVIASEQEGSVLSFTLPEGATNLQFQDGSLGQPGSGTPYIETPGGFGDTTPIRPGSGEYQILFAFDMPYNRKLDLKQPVNIPVNAIVLLMPEGGVKVKGENLQNAGTRDVQGVTYHMYSSGRLEAGKTFSLAISGDPKGGNSILSSKDARLNLVIGLGTLGVVLILTGVLMYRRSKKGIRAVSDEFTPAPDEAQPQDPNSLMDAIIALDDLFKAGKLPEEAYRQRRGELKKALEKVIRD